LTKIYQNSSGKKIHTSTPFVQILNLAKKEKKPAKKFSQHKKIFLIKYGSVDPCCKQITRCL
jgi:hypothetical protein